MGILVCEMLCQCFLISKIFLAFKTTELCHMRYQTHVISMSSPVAEKFATLPTITMPIPRLMYIELGHKREDMFAMVTAVMMLSAPV